MSHSVAALNELLARSLGRNPYGEGMFRWENSADLYWPEFPTGRTTTKRVEIPIIGGGGVESCDSLVPEYHSVPMCPKLDRQWVVTLWYPPESLGHWQARFPGAVYPARGYRINTNASLPSFPGGPREPNLHETERFIRLLIEQRSQGTHAAVTEAMIAEHEQRKDAINQEIQDEVVDSFNAFMNPEPGARGGFVSFPSHQRPDGPKIVLP